VTGSFGNLWDDADSCYCRQGSFTDSSVSSRIYSQLWLRIRCVCFGHGEIHGWEILSRCLNVSARLISLWWSARPLLRRLTIGPNLQL
jgi:hypothetical protein